MHLGVGILMIVVAGAVGVVVVLGPWRSMAAGLAIGSMAVCGMAIAAGGLLVQQDVGLASWVVALAVLGTLSPAHARLVFGPPGSARGVVAPGAAAA